VVGGRAHRATSVTNVLTTPDDPLGGLRPPAAGDGDRCLEVQDRQGDKEDPRLITLLGCLIELFPWLKHRHNDIDATYNMAMGDYFAGFVQEESHSLNLTLEEIKAWQPPQQIKKKATRKKAARKKTTTKQASEAEEYVFLPSLPESDVISHNPRRNSSRRKKQDIRGRRCQNLRKTPYRR